MIRRILLVAWMELRATLVTRAFIVMVLTPVIALVVAPLIIAPVVLLGTLTEDSEAPEVAVPRVEIQNASEPLLESLQTQLQDQWEVVSIASGDDAPSLYEGDATARIALGQQALSEGAYTIQKRMTSDRNQRDIEVLHTAVKGVLGEARVIDAGLSPDVARQALTVRGSEETSDPTPEEALALFANFAEYLVPSGVLFMMFGALSMAGQGLLTSTLEEKSTRVAEVLLGALSPVELLTGKILGQLGVSLIFAMVWGGPSLLGLAWFGSYYLGPLTVLYLFGFIGIASVSWAAVMGGIGSAVNDLTEAQHLLAPLFMVMMLFFLPALFAIARPDSGFIVAASLIPPSSTTVMAARLTSSIPPPFWQVWISLLSSGAFAVALLWAAGRLFRIGLLLSGSPPNVRTLIRWILTS